MTSSRFSPLWTPEEELTLGRVDQWRWVSSVSTAGVKPVRHRLHQEWMDLPGNSYAPPHREVMLTFRGKAVHRLEGKIYERTPGMVMLFDRHELRDLKGAPHKTAFHCLWLHLSGEETVTFNSNSCDAKGRYFQELPLGVRRGPSVRLLHSAWDRWRAEPKNPLGFEWLKAQVAALLLEIAHTAHTESPPVDQHEAVVQVVEEYIQHHLSGDLSLHALARIAGYSPFFFHRLFLRTTGQTPGAYVTTFRLQQAKTLLRKGWTVKATAEQVGFESLSYFNRFFRKETGRSPGAWGKAG